MSDNADQRSGRDLTAELESRFPNQDYVAALGKTLIRSRHEIEQMLQAPRVSQQLADAVAALPRTLRQPDPLSTDDVFQARTNDRSAAMEIDGERGMIVSPGSNGMSPGTRRDV